MRSFLGAADSWLAGALDHTKHAKNVIHFLKFVSPDDGKECPGGCLLKPSRILASLELTRRLL
jgi:hypothetical protein